MAFHYRTQGFVLKKTDRGESDQVLTVYTKDFGKLEILGKAIRKIKSKLRSGVDLFYFSEIEFIQGKVQKTLTDALLVDRFRNVRKDPEKLKIINRISEDIDNLIETHEKDEKIWRFLETVLEKLDSDFFPEKSRPLLYQYFVWNLLSSLGYGIDLYNCAVCQEKLSPQKLYFNAEEGGIVDCDCFLKTKKGKELSPEAVKIARLFMAGNWNILKKLSIDDSCRQSIEDITGDYLSHYKGVA